MEAGSKVYVSHTPLDAACFPEPDVVDPRRPIDSYVQYIAGPHAFLGAEINQVAVTEMFRAVFKCKGLARAPGPQGELKKVVDKEGGKLQYMREDWGQLTSLPVTMKVTWDE